MRDSRSNNYLLHIPHYPVINYAIISLVRDIFPMLCNVKRPEIRGHHYHNGLIICADRRRNSHLMSRRYPPRPITPLSLTIPRHPSRTTARLSAPTGVRACPETIRTLLTSRSPPSRPPDLPALRGRGDGEREDAVGVAVAVAVVHVLAAVARGPDEDGAPAFPALQNGRNGGGERSGGTSETVVNEQRY